ncbi:Casein kinase I isoform gamma-1 [Penicillium rolfsii]|nr:Casein kinase I isoform gamma-1 [Penicillium rolfsii]
MSSLSDEASILHSASGGVGIPCLQYFGSYNKWSVMITDEWGYGLDEVFEQSGRNFSMQMILLLSIHLLSRLHFLHSRNIVHGNLSPQSFAVGNRSWQSHHVMMVNFKITKDRQKTRRDDLIALGHILSFFANGTASWEDYRLQKKNDPPFLTAYMDMISSSRSIDYAVLQDIFVKNYKEFVWHTGIALELKGPRALKQSLTPNLGHLLTCDTGTLRQLLSSRISITRQHVFENSLPSHACSLLDTLDYLFEVYMAVFVRYHANDIEHSMKEIWGLMHWILKEHGQSPLSFRLSILNKFYGLFGVLFETLPSFHFTCSGYLSKIALLFAQIHPSTSSIYYSLQTVTYWHSFRNQPGEKYPRLPSHC